ncbi:type VII toxin-antitoxin system MntA family adenylyltransferase antitoxin [Paenibacillus sp. FA6]|uniref:type VII toxin-antitoxin system MntA family adenylyltransferase antitoxin n=1 Tax=Paenibacillus sp. FA6 TaxID=3413029 RepID=UPI003F65C3B3
MNLMGLTATQKNELIQFVSHELHAYAVILFGSAAKNMLRPDSDVDIAFLSDNTYSPYDIFMTSQSLADLLHREVDLIDFRAASSVFKAQIVDKGRNV